MMILRSFGDRSVTATFRNTQAIARHSEALTRIEGAIALLNHSNESCDFTIRFDYPNIEF